MMASNALKAMKRGDIVWIDKVVRVCEDCGADISHAQRVQVKTFDEYSREFKVDHGQNKGKHKAAYKAGIDGLKQVLNNG